MNSMIERNDQSLDHHVEFVIKKIIERKFAGTKENHINPRKNIIINKRSTGLMMMKVMTITDKT